MKEAPVPVPAENGVDGAATAVTVRHEEQNEYGEYGEYGEDGETAEQDTNDDIQAALDDPKFAEFRKVFQRFAAEEQPQAEQEEDDGRGDMFYSDDEEEMNGDSKKQEGQDDELSKKQQKKIRKIPLAELKANAPKPELVEWFDADAADPDLVIQMKGVRGAVPVPDHWQFKREFLSSKRGPRKRPFQLPEFIKATGIMEMRDALKEDDRTLAQKSRERVMPKLGTLDLDFGKVRDAFFKHQTKPRLYRYGEVYYEGKENNRVDWSQYRPGEESMTQELRNALGIAAGAPPPWIIQMQKFGPPPSYPGLRIRGVNAPAPAGAPLGYKPGEWGRPPRVEDIKEIVSAPTSTQLWGELISDEESSEEEGEEEDEEMEEEEDEDEEMEQRQIQQPQEAPEIVNSPSQQIKRSSPSDDTTRRPERRKRRRFEDAGDNQDQNQDRLAFERDLDELMQQSRK